MDADADNHHELIKRAQSGDVDAFAELVEAHQGLVFNVVMRSLNNRETAQDITQEVFIQVWKTIANFDDRAKFSTWLYRIAMNALISHLRFTRAQKRGGEKADLSFDHNEEHRLDPSHDRRREGSEASSGDAEMERSETHDEVLQAIASLDEEAKSVVVLRDIEGLSYEEIAEVLEINVGTVRSRLHRARERLREKLSHLMP